MFTPFKAEYILDGWKGSFTLRVLKAGQTLRFSIEHETEGTIKLTSNEGNQLMKALMHFFNKEVKQ